MITVLSSYTPTSADTIVSWTWSEELETGITYYWNVTEFTFNGEDVLTHDNSSFPIRTGSIISINLNQPLYGLNYLELVNQSTLDYLFSIRVDGTFTGDVGNLGIEFFYPNTVVWSNGSEVNLFSYDEPKYASQFRFPDTGIIHDGVYIFTLDDWYSSTLIARDISTGILVTWLIIYDEGSLRYDYIGYTDQSLDETKNLNSISNSIRLDMVSFISTIMMTILFVKYYRIHQRQISC